MRRKELDFLLTVKTTPTEARAIIKRNESVIRELTRALPALARESLPEGWKQRSRNYVVTVTLGCPHCRPLATFFPFLCRDCVWTKASEKKDKAYACVTARFGGITLNEISALLPLSLGYAPDFYELLCETRYKHMEIDRYRRELYACARLIRRFARDHIVWAKAHLARRKRNDRSL